MRTRTFGLFFSGAFLLAGLGQAATVFSGAGATPADIQATVDDFRDALGTLNGNLPQNFVGGRREINWDGVPDAFADPNAFPGDFFNAGVAGRARGIEFNPTGASSGFQVSSTAASGEPIEFGLADDFTVFSPERLFTPVGGATFDAVFFDPSDQTTPAASRGFGAVFTGAGAGDSSLTFYDRFGAVLAQGNAPATGVGGLSFLGVLFDDPLVARVAFGLGEVAVLDDFIYGEPSPIPLPAGLPLLGFALAALAALRRRPR